MQETVEKIDSPTYLQTADIQIDKMLINVKFSPKICNMLIISDIRFSTKM